MRPLTRARVALLAACLLAQLLPQGCKKATRRSAVPDRLQTTATVPGFSTTIRYFPRDAAHVEGFEKDYLEGLDREKAYLRAQGKTGPLPPAAFLAISGGGDGGAFGAGLLNGWTKTGSRPQFKLVTGVSTGALIAPFAFLGEKFDGPLRSLYTHVSQDSIARKRSVFTLLYQDAMSDTEPLWKLVKKYVTQDLLDAIAVEHGKGRVLLVATTNLDARRPVIWNVTKIAASKAPGSLDLVRKILVASSAIPGTFPPVMIDVEAAGKSYQEMHVDGGTTSQVFVYPAAIHLHELAARQRTLYIIRNARLDPEWAQVEPRILPIAFRAISCLVQYQGMGDLYTIFTICQRDHVQYRLAFIPPTFDTPHTAIFDPAYMKALFDVGERLAVEGQDWWYKHPPLLLSGVEEEKEIF